MGNKNHWKKDELGFFSSHTKVNSKYIKNLNVKDKTLKCLEEKVGKYISDVESGMISQDKSLRKRLMNLYIIKTSVHQKILWNEVTEKTETKRR